ncbi:AIPR family protein [Paenibacillus elgii]|uniref:AIPR family protein n=1 Tax=Paenibacillus elgii TaxID=189691 RepID=UPI0013D450FB|nr:AIPR family protein [Paenibacillus elgii]
MDNHKQKLVDSKIRRFMDKNNIEKEDTAFLYFVYCVFNDCEYDDIDFTDIVEGSEDKQIDIISVEQDDVDAIHISLIQVKNEKGFSPNTIIGIRNGIDWILNRSDSEVSGLGNFALRSKIEMIRELLQEKNLGLKQSSINVYYVTRGSKNDISENNEVIAEKSRLEKELLVHGFGESSFTLVGLDDIFEMLENANSKRRAIDAEIPIKHDSSYPMFIETYSDEFSSLICTVKASEIAKIVSNDAIFDRNIRKYLDTRGKVNQKIYETCSKEEESKYFWFLNNGITMICDDFDLKKIPGKFHVSLKNIQIVNGCQTSETIYKAYKDEVLNENAEVLVKIYGTTDPSFVDKIVLSTNNQNPINARDLRANEECQRNIQSVIKENYGLFFERKRSEYRLMQRSERQHIVSNEKVGQAALALLFNQPHNALSNKGIIFNDYFETIFNKQSIPRLLYSYLIYGFVEKKKKQSKKEAQSDIRKSIVLYGSFHLTKFVSCILTMKKDLPKDNECHELCLDIINKKMEDKLEIAYDVSLNALENGISEHLRTKPLNFFKRAESTKKINEILEHTLSSMMVGKH